MNKSDALNQRCEDALFYLVLNQIAEQEGLQLMEQNKKRLSTDTDVPQEITDRCLKKLLHTSKKEQNTYKAKKVLKLTGKIAIAAIIPICLFSMAIASYKVFGNNSFEITEDKFSEETTIQIDNTKSEQLPVDNAPMLDPEQLPIPDDYHFYSEMCLNRTQMYTYENDEGDFLDIMRSDLTGSVSTSIVDTENAEVTYEMIGDTEVMVVKKDGNAKLIWFDQTKQIKYSITGKPEIAMEICRSILLQEQ